MLKFKNNILKKIISNGFSFDISTESTIKINDNITIRYQLSDCYNYFTIDFIDEKYDSGNILSLRVRNLVTTENVSKPEYSISTYDDISCFSDINSSFPKFKILSEMSHFSRTNAISIVEDLMENEAILVNISNKNNLLLIEKEKQQTKKYELARLKRIADYESKNIKIGKEKARLIIEKIENFIFKCKEPITINKDFIFLNQSGYETTKTIFAVWERDRLSWKDQRNNLMTPEEVIELVSKSREEVKNIA